MITWNISQLSTILTLSICLNIILFYLCKYIDKIRKYLSNDIISIIFSVFIIALFKKHVLLKK